jgi:hypothetical protein
MNSRVSLLISLVIGAMAMAGCGHGDAGPLALAAGEQFHRQLDQGDSKAIYEACLPEFKAGTKEQDFTAALDAMHSRLGLVESATARTPVITSHHFKTDVTLPYQTKFAKGAVNETLYFRIEGGKAILRGYESAAATPTGQPKAPSATPPASPH